MKNSLAKANENRRKTSMEKFDKAVEADTLAEAVEQYGSSREGFRQAAVRYGRLEELSKRWPGEIGPSARDRAEANRLRGQARRAILVEDAEFLLKTGEHPDNAVKRLGYKSRQALERALERAGRADIFYNLLRNDAMSWGPMADRSWS